MPFQPSNIERDTELFELCKEVYRRTGWESRSVDAQYFTDRDERGEQIPLYTSDYILEKLPRQIRRYGRFELVPTMRNTVWSAGYWTTNRLETLSVTASTPLKALLRLVAILSNAGELNQQGTQDSHEDS